MTVQPQGGRFLTHRCALMTLPHGGPAAVFRRRGPDRGARVNVAWHRGRAAHFYRVELTEASMRDGQKRPALVVLLATSALLAVSGALILTDAGQLISIGKPVVVEYFRVHRVVMAAATLFLVVAVCLNQAWKQLRTWQVAVIGLFVVGCFVATKLATPYIMFPSKQETAVYTPVRETAGYLDSDDVVYVVERNGVARAYPQKYIWQAHIFGGDYRGEEVVFTYCVLTNLPVPYLNDLDGERMSLKVLAQTNNNLLLWDRNSGEIIQQITNTCELSGRTLEPLPVLEMSWRAFSALYPDAEVAYTPFESPLERLLDFLMPLEAAHGGDDWMFRTVDLDDDRLPSKEKIIGVADGSEAVAYTRDALRRAGVVNVSVGERALVIAHVPEHDVFVAFDRVKDGRTLTVEEVDFHGDTPAHGRLERAFVYNGPMWAVWAHYFPATRLVK